MPLLHANFAGPQSALRAGQTHHNTTHASQALGCKLIACSELYGTAVHLYGKSVDRTSPTCYRLFLRLLADPAARCHICLSFHLTERCLTLPTGIHLQSHTLCYWTAVLYITHCAAHNTAAALLAMLELPACVGSLAAASRQTAVARHSIHAAQLSSKPLSTSSLHCLVR